MRVVGKPDRHACNVPSTGRALVGGEVVDVTPEDAVQLCAGGHASLTGPSPAWWPRTIPAHGQDFAVAHG